MLVPILLLIMLGAIDFGRAYFSYVVVNNAARTGAQYAAASQANAGDSEGITEAALQDAGSLKSHPTVTSVTGTDSRGKTFARVTVSYGFHTIFDWPGLPGSVTLRTTAQMRVAP